MRTIVRICQPAALVTVCGSMLPAQAAETATLPTQFAGEALTVALAFAMPALAAGAYLAMQRLRQRLGVRTAWIMVLTVLVIAAVAYVVEDTAGVLQRAGLASLR